jgi:hypothetical protein
MKYENVNSKFLRVQIIFRYRRMPRIGESFFQTDQAAVSVNTLGQTKLQRRQLRKGNGECNQQFAVNVGYLGECEAFQCMSCRRMSQRFYEVIHTRILRC